MSTARRPNSVSFLILCALVISISAWAQGSLPPPGGGGGSGMGPGAVRPLLIMTQTPQSSERLVGGQAGAELVSFVLEARGDNAVIREAPFIVLVTAPRCSDLLTTFVLEVNGTKVAGPAIEERRGSVCHIAFRDGFVLPKGTMAKFVIKANIHTLTEGAKEAFIVLVGLPLAYEQTTGHRMQTVGRLVFGNLRTVLSHGTLSVVLDANNPSEVLAAAGNEATFVLPKFSATDEPIRLNMLPLRVDGPRSCLLSVSVWNGATKIGDGVVPPVGPIRVNLFNGIVVPKNGLITATVRGMTAPIGPTQPCVPGANIRVNYDGAERAQAVGLVSGIQIKSQSPNTNAPGVWIYRSYPVVRRVALPKSGVPRTGTVVLYRGAAIARQSGDVGLGKMNFSIDVCCSVGFQLHAVSTHIYADSSYTSPAPYPPFGMSDSLAGKHIVLDALGHASVKPLEVPAGTIIYFELRGAVSGGEPGDTITTGMLGDAARFAIGDFATAAMVLNFVWSGNSFRTSGLADKDWAGGRNIPGLPAIPMPAAKEVVRW